MAEESGGAGWWGSWGSELISSVRDKSTEALNMVKHDLSEFVSTIQHDTSAVVADTATAVKESLKVEEGESEGTSTRFKQGVSKFLGTLSSSLRENISHVTSAAASATSDGPEPVFDRMQAQLHEIQTDPSTFCSEPDGHLGMYEEWCKTFDPEQHKGEISELLVNVPEIRALYAKLVPSAVSHVLFWQRYFYKVHQLEQEEKKRAALVARANQAEDEELGWGDDDLWDTEEAGVESVLSKHVSNEGEKDVVPDKGNLTNVGDKELANEASNQVKGEETEVVRQPLTAVNKQEKPDFSIVSKQDTSEESRQDEKFEVKEKLSEYQQDPPAELVAKRTEQMPQSQESVLEIINAQHKGPSSSEASKTQITGTNDETVSSQRQTATHKRDNSSGSVDSSWSKLSEANSDKEGGRGERNTGSGHSSSSSSGVLVPGVDDKDVDWDDDLDLDADDMSEEEVKRIMESMAANKQVAGNQEGADVEDDDWENWD